MQVQAIKKNNHFEIPDLDNLNLTQNKVTLSFDYEKYENTKELNNNIPDAKPDSLQAIFNKILGKNAQVRSNVSIGEDRRNLMKGMWDKYGQ